MVKNIFAVTVLLLIVCYPVLIYFGLHHLKPSQIGLMLVSLFFLRLCFSYHHSGKALAIPLSIVGIAIATIAIVSNSTISLTFYPVIINTIMLLLFGHSLFTKQSMIERLARLQHPELPPEGVYYTRKVTIVWTIFFTLNGLFALYTALYCSIKVWTLYNGLIAYILMGMLFVGEYTYRRLVLKVN